MMVQKDEKPIPEDLLFAWEKLVYACKTKFYGKITFKFEAGVIVQKITEDSELPPKRKNI